MLREPVSSIGGASVARTLRHLSPTFRLERSVVRTKDRQTALGAVIRAVSFMLSARADGGDDATSMAEHAGARVIAEPSPGGKPTPVLQTPENILMSQRLRKQAASKYSERLLIDDSF